jgi:hypothetical protein
MKEIMIRAWDKKNNKMIYPPSPCSSNPGPGITLDGRMYINGVYQDLVYLPWTGLIDRDAEYIYEGDILGGHFEGGWIEYCETCKNFQYHLGYGCSACEGDVHWYELVEDDGALEVVGNIYENPDLQV